MGNKWKELSKISMVITVIIIGGIFIAKTLYYAGQMQSDYFDSIMMCLIWSFISILFSLSPMIMLALSNLFILINKNKMLVLTILTIISCCILLGINIILEIVSMLGAAMCLDGEWIDITSKMLLYHFISAIPIILTFIALLRMGKRSNTVTDTSLK